MNENQIAREVVDAAVKVHRMLGAGCGLRGGRGFFHFTIFKQGGLTLS